jgi:hypothetical protein
MKKRREKKRDKRENEQGRKEMLEAHQNFDDNMTDTIGNISTR